MIIKSDYFYIEINFLTHTLLIKENKNSAFSIKKEITSLMDSNSYVYHVIQDLTYYEQRVVFFFSNFLIEKKVDFNVYYSGNGTISLQFCRYSDEYEFSILDNKIALRIYDKNVDYGGFVYEEVSKVFYTVDELLSFIEEVILIK